MTTKLLSAQLSSLLLASMVGATPPTFTGLTNPIPGGYVDGVLGVNASGTVVVGYSYKPTSPDFGDRSFRWRSGIGFDNPGPSQGSVLSYASGVSASGNVVVGNTGHAQFGDQEAWVRVGNSTGHIGSPPGSNFSVLRGVSADGRVCVGWGGQQSNPNSGQAAYYDTIADHWTNLGFLPGGTVSKAMAASADGSRIVGLASAGQYLTRAFMWTAATGMQPIGTGNLPNGNEATALGISADGSVVVGTDYVIDENFNSIFTTWRWTQATGMVAIATDFYVAGVSPDGREIVGTSQAQGYNEPAIWDETHGLRNLQAMLAQQGVDPTAAGWSMSGATAISQSGPVEHPLYTVAGEGGDPAGFIAGWVVTIDEMNGPCIVITNQPINASACHGSPAEFGIVVTGAGPFTYQWQIETAPGVWATLGNDPMPMACDGGGFGAFAYASNPMSEATPIGVHPCPGVTSYQIRCVVSNRCGSITSDEATLRVCCNSDINCDGIVNVSDLLAVITNWGVCRPPPATCPADIAPPGPPVGDGEVNVGDLLAVITSWG